MVRSTLALAAVLSVASISLAGDLVTPPLWVGGSHNSTCKLVNITSAPIPAQVQMIEEGGAVLVDSGQITVGPSQVLDYGNAGLGKSVYCRFVNANIRRVRAGLTVWAASSDATDITIVPAQ
jgi:hypothetical protein